MRRRPGRSVTSMRSSGRKASAQGFARPLATGVTVSLPSDVAKASGVRCARTGPARKANAAPTIATTAKDRIGNPLGAYEAAYKGGNLPSMRCPGDFQHPQRAEYEKRDDLTTLIRGVGRDGREAAHDRQQQSEKQGNSERDRVRVRTDGERIRARDADRHGGDGDHRRERQRSRRDQLDERNGPRPPRRPFQGVAIARRARRPIHQSLPRIRCVVLAADDRLRCGRAFGWTWAKPWNFG